MGRRKLEIKAIEDLQSRKITLSKRRKGLLKKATEVGILCDVPVLVFGMSRPPGEILFSQGSPVDTIQKYGDLSQDVKERANQDMKKDIQKWVTMGNEETSRGLEDVESYEDLLSENTELKASIVREENLKASCPGEGRLFPNGLDTSQYNSTKSCEQPIEVLLWAISVVDDRINQLEEEQAKKALSSAPTTSPNMNQNDSTHYPINVNERDGPCEDQDQELPGSFVMQENSRNDLMDMREQDGPREDGDQEVPRSLVIQETSMRDVVDVSDDEDEEREEVAAGTSNHTNRKRERAHKASQRSSARLKRALRTSRKDDGPGKATEPQHVPKSTNRVAVVQLVTLNLFSENDNAPASIPIETESAMPLGKFLEL